LKKFVDTANIQIKAGDGGRGAVSFRREKYVPKGGPDGGKGGKGGDVILEPAQNIQTLLDLRFQKLYKAKNGDAGRGKNQTGRNGADNIIQLPKGTLVFDKYGAQIADLIDAPFTVAKGGKGGSGNKSFSTSTNRVPRYAQSGLPGEEIEITLELRLLAEVGLIGLPNAGKSTLLKSLTNAHPRIASYPFTTKYPNLGVLKTYDREIIIADIPGLIEGASDGAGLGHHFLRHIDRTHTLIHLVEIPLENPESAIDNYNIIQNELKKSQYNLEKKPQIVVLNKIDLLDDETIKKIQAQFQQKNIDPIPISAHTGKGIQGLSSKL